MRNDKHWQSGHGEPDHTIELDHYLGDLPTGRSGDEVTRPVHRDQYVEYSHELPERAAEAMSRVLVRIVPLVYGGLLGHLGGRMGLGLLLGFVSAAAFDLYMGDKSMLRTQGRWMALNLCPRLAALARTVADLVERLGGRVPAFLRRMHCGA